MATALAKLRTDVDRDDVLRAIKEYDRLGPDQFFAKHGFGPSRNYQLVWERRRYPHKAILGTAYEFATETLRLRRLRRRKERRRCRARNAGIHRQDHASVDPKFLRATDACL